MRARIPLSVVFVVVAAVLWPSVARAGDWPPPVCGALLLAYGVPWMDGAGRSCVHRGVDLAAHSGDTVASPVAGEVTFAGAVPGASGGTVVAVTVQTADGLKVTCTPLRSAVVSEGFAVVPGQALGPLGEDGDGSVSATHVHLSVRRGDVTLDPAGFLRAAAPPPVIAPVEGVPEGPSGLVAEVAQRAVASAPVAQAPVVAPEPNAARAVPAAPPAATVPASGVLERALASVTARSAPLTAVHRLPGSPRVDLDAVLAGVRRWDGTWRAVAARSLLAAFAFALVAPLLRRGRSPAWLESPVPARAVRVPRA